MSRGNWDGLTRYGLPGLLAGLVLTLWAGGHGPMARAQGTVPAVDSNGIMALTSPASGSSPLLLFLIDTKSPNAAFAVYRVEPNNPKGSLKLEASRQYRSDLKLMEFNNQSPTVSGIQEMVGPVNK